MVAAVRGGLERAAAVALAAVLVFITADHYLGLLSGQPARWLRGIGKETGSLAATLAAVAVVYYFWSKVCGALAKRGVIRPGSVAKNGLALLRLTHPLIGATALTAAVLHGYIMWSGRWPLREISGLAALAALLLLAVSGWPSAAGSSRGRRALHRLAALAFVLLLALH